MELFSVNISLAFTSGMVAAFNPCGVVLLPTYIAYLLTQKNEDSQSFSSSLSLVGFGLKVGLLMTSGFISIFLLAGIGFSAMGSVIYSVAPWLTVAVGLIMVIVGILLLFKPEHFHFISKMTSGLGAQVKSENSFNYYLYGIGYAIASLGCTLPVFMVVIFTSFTAGNFYQGVFNFFLYGLGMGIVVTIITLISLFAREFIQNWLQKIVPYINKIAAVFIIVTGIYLIIYWTFGI